MALGCGNVSGSVHAPTRRGAHARLGAAAHAPRPEELSARGRCASAVAVHAVVAAGRL
jgi:hypothetical protein